MVLATTMQWLGILPPSKNSVHETRPIRVPIMENKERTIRILNELLQDSAFNTFYNKVKSLYDKIIIVGNSSNYEEVLKRTNAFITIGEKDVVITYNETLTDTDVKLSIIVELGNAYHKDDYLNVRDCFVNTIYNKDQYATRMENIEWNAMRDVKHLIQRLIPQNDNPYPEKFFEDFNYAFRQQHKTGHYQIILDHFLPGRN